MKYLVNGEEADLLTTGTAITESEGVLRVQTEEGSVSAVAVRRGDTVSVSLNGRVYTVEKFSALRTKDHGAGTGEARSPMPGQVVEILVEVGQSVAKGDRLLVLEAMKMQQPIIAGIDGLVKRIEVTPGDQVSDGQLLVEVVAP